ncbi:MAG: tetratricopeptide repeat protein [Campylobacterota bacterium]|nr:tetratricopeptide repeat protein [Campylobacterota bacterium]
MIKILFSLILANSLNADILSDANNKYKNGQIKDAIKLYNKASREGIDEASFQLGLIYYKGVGIKKDISKAMKYFKKASLYGHKKASYNVATIYGQKQYKEHNFTKAFDIYQELAKDGYGKAQDKVATYLLYGLGIPKDYKLSVRWFEESYFKNNYQPASCGLALMYASGKGVFPNLGRARKLAVEGYEKKIPLCVKVYKEFNLQKYDEDKGFKYGFYK